MEHTNYSCFRGEKNFKFIDTKLSHYDTYISLQLSKVQQPKTLMYYKSSHFIYVNIFSNFTSTQYAVNTSHLKHSYDNIFSLLFSLYQLLQFYMIVFPTLFGSFCHVHAEPAAISLLPASSLLRTILPSACQLTHTLYSMYSLDQFWLACFSKWQYLLVNPKIFLSFLF